MAVLFEPPQAPAPIEVQAECQALHDEMIRMAPRRVISAHERAESQSKQNGAAIDGENAAFAAREPAIRESGMRIGAQAGLAWRYRQINSLLEEPEIESALDRAFNFNRMVTDDNVIYPVISEAQESFSTASDGQTARSSRMTWTIIRPARIATKAANWRAYLHQAVEDPDKPARGLLPYDSTEKAIWRETLCEGFAQGVDQANWIFHDRMTRLVRDYAGMLRYKVLETQGIVNEPEVAEGRMGVRVSADGETVHVDDRMIRITDSVRFQESSNWEAIRSMRLDPSKEGRP